MKLFSLLKNIHCRVLGTTALEINGLYHKDTEVKEKGLFFCLRGTRVDGTAYVKSAINNGAVAVVTEQEILGLVGTTQIIVKNAREVMSQLACKFFKNPAERLKIIGITGTNGKTTTSTMIYNILNFAGKKTALVGTNGVFIGGKKYDSEMTTPDPIELQKYFSMMVRAGCEYVCMEVSAHALDLFKIEGFKVDISVFTNLTEDHLDYFKTMERYFQAKEKLFLKKTKKVAIINIDDEFGQKLVQNCGIKTVTFSLKNSADYFAEKLWFEGGKQYFVSRGTEFLLNLAGRFNVQNALSAIAVLTELGIDQKTIKQGFSLIQAVDGRFNTYLVAGVTVVIDYAHTPDGLKNILSACKGMAGENKVISVFGCGGNREIEKRKIMGEISSTLASYTIITTDNPRFEKRESIAKDIEKGMKNNNYKIELDRGTAIKEAIEMAGVGDIVVVAGKGSENYIDENGMKIPYSDKHEVEKIRRLIDDKLCSNS